MNVLEEEYPDLNRHHSTLEVRLQGLSALAHQTPFPSPHPNPGPDRDQTRAEEAMEYDFGYQRVDDRCLREVGAKTIEDWEMVVDLTTIQRGRFGR